jgi:hypothetical protein
MDLSLLFVFWEIHQKQEKAENGVRKRGFLVFWHTYTKQNMAHWSPICMMPINPSKHCPVVLLNVKWR